MKGRGLVLENVSFSYLTGTAAAREVLSGIDLELRPGEVLCLMGRSGSGKSTLLQVMAGLLPPTSGRVLGDGLPLNEYPPRVGLLLQNPEQQLFAATVFRDVAFGPRMAGLRGRELRRRVEEALHMVGLDPARYGERVPFALSGGEARRVALAGILALEPSYLLLDEPFSGLDGSSRRRIASLLNRLREGGKGILLVTHDWREVEMLADRVAVLAEGRLALQGPPETVARRHPDLSRAGLLPPDLFRLALALGLEGSLETPFPSLSEMTEILEAALTRVGKAAKGLPHTGRSSRGESPASSWERDSGDNGFRIPEKQGEDQRLRERGNGD